MVEQNRAETGSRVDAPHRHAFVSFLSHAGGLPVVGRKWSQMAGESTKRFSIAGNATTFPSRFVLSPTIQLTFCGSNW